jgi:hypothetical protein
LPALAEQTRQAIPPDKVPEGLQKSDWRNIHAAHNAWKHEFRQVDGKWQAHNPGQRWNTAFDDRGFLAKPKEAEWTWGLELVSYGFAANPIPVSGLAVSSAAGQKLTYRWQGGLEEWYVNDERGLEHGYTIATRPEGFRESEPLVFTIATRGTLSPSVSSDQQTVHFRDAGGAPVLNYSGLKVWDADGKILASRFAPAEGDHFRLLVEETGAKYPLTIDPIAQQAYLKASNTPGGSGEFDNFGRSVAVSGDTVVVGSPREDSGTKGVNSTPNENAIDSGAAYVFVRNGTTWSQQAYLKAGNTGAGDEFGGSVAVFGDMLVVGASREDSSTTGMNSTPNNGAIDSGAAYVFVRNGAAWSQQAYLKASNTGLGDLFGESVAVSAGTVVVGTFGEGAYVFVRNGTAWSQQAYLKVGDTDDLFGISVAVSVDTVVVGARFEDSGTKGVNSTPNESARNSGAAYVFVRIGTSWSQQAYLKASDTWEDDYFGSSVAVSGDTLVVGAYGKDLSQTGVSAYGTGAAYVFVRNGTAWSQQAYLKAGNNQGGDYFGQSVAVSGDTVVVGASNEGSSTTGVNSTPNESASQSGAAYVFVRNGTAWSQQAFIKASNTGAIDYFGSSVAVSGDMLVVGALGEDSGTTGVNSTHNDGTPDSGAAYVFVNTGTQWSQQAFLKSGNNGTSRDEFGKSVAVSGDTVVVGSPREDSGTKGINSTPNESVPDSGAVYVFVRNGETWSQQAYLKASKTGVEDSFGTSVAVSGDTIVVGAPYEDSETSREIISTDDFPNYTGAAYVFVRNGTAWSQQAYLKASNTGADDTFGASVAVSGDALVVGAPNEDSGTTGVNSTPDEIAPYSGAAYVFVRYGNEWSQQAYLKASNTGAFDRFGASVAVSGDALVVGAPYEDSATTGVNSTPDEIGNSSGAAYVFARNGMTWSQQAYLKASNAEGGDLFGKSVAVSGDTVVVGAAYEDANMLEGAHFEASSISAFDSDYFATDSGAAYVFVRSGTAWSQQAYLKAGNTGAGDNFGTSVAVSGDTLVVGAWLEDSATTGVNSTPNENSSDSGAAYVFVRNGKIWSQQAYLKASNTGEGDLFGTSVAVSGDTVVVGAWLEDSGTKGVNSQSNDNANNSGAAYIFTGFDPGLQPPAISAPGSSAIAETTATLGGKVTNAGGAPISGRGVVYSIASANPNPVIGGAGVIQATTSGTTGAFTVAVSGLSPGTRYAFRAYATNSNSTTYTLAAIFATSFTPRQAFNNAMTLAGLTDADALPTAAPQNDEVNNLLKYAFNMNLSGADVRSLVPGTGTSGLPSITTNSSGDTTILRVEFVRRIGSGLLYTPKRSSDLINGSWMEFSDAPTITPINAVWERVIYEEPLPTATTPRCFGRVEVVLP